MIYLDYASNTPVDPAVLEVFCRTEQQYFGNPTSTHGLGRTAHRQLEQVTASVAERLGVQPTEVIFTSGASEANNLALKGIARSYRHGGKHILTTCLEHPSVSGSLTALQEQGYEVELIDIRPDGKVCLSHLQELLRRDTILVSVCWVDSELGTVQPIPEIRRLLQDYPNCRLHVDATQAMGKIPLDPKLADCVTFAPHKFHGLNGCGVLVKRGDLVLEPMIHGGRSATIYRSGTPALALAASVEAALRLALEEREPRYAKVASMKNKLTEALGQYPLVSINSPVDSSPYILNIGVAGVKSDAFQQALDQRGVCVSVKSACSVHGMPSRPVFAVTRDKKRAASSWRISLSHLVERQELDDFLAIFEQCYKELTS